MAHKKPITILRKELDESHLLRESDQSQGLPVAILEIEPRGQTRISLGEYTLDRPPIGFSIVVTPDYEKDDVIAQITRLSATFDEYELTLHIANYQDCLVVVEVYQLRSKGFEVATIVK